MKCAAAYGVVQVGAVYLGYCHKHTLWHDGECGNCIVEVEKVIEDHKP